MADGRDFRGLLDELLGDVEQGMAGQGARG